MNRLDTATTLSGTTSSTVDYDYDAHGNLTLNRLGALAYAQTNGASLYGVTTAGGNAYGYDAYGNATTLGSRAAQYDVFNKPTRIGNTQFVYGPTHEKVKTVSGGTTTYHYAGGGYLEENTGSNLITKAYVGGYYLRETTGGNTTEHYLHFDHLGSVEAISDGDGNFVTRMSFDAYGNRRNSDWTPQTTPTSASTFATARGFTGHDMVDAEAVVHMGGRVYDPAIGRFLSADLYVQSPDSSQSYNRYAYVTNNPLSRIDPTGYETCELGEECEEVIVTGQRDAYAWLAGMKDFYALRDWAAYNSDWRQMAQLGGEWSQASTEFLFTEGFQPAFEGGIEVAFNIQTGSYGAAIGAGAMTGVEMTAGKIAKGAKGAKAALEGAGEVAEGAGDTTTLYRAVSKAELEDIAENGLRTTAGGYETGKLFATSVDDAAKFGKNNFKLDGIPNHLIKVDVPNSVMKDATKFRADFMDAVSIPADMLNKLNSTPLNYSPLVK